MTLPNGSKGRLPECPELACNAHEGACMRGQPLGECPTYARVLKGSKQGQTDIPMPEPGALYPNWTGNALTPHTASEVMGLGRPIVIAVVGLPDVGKTSLLTSFYDRIRREHLGGRYFAGSYTLRGWAALARYLRWQGNVPPAYPPRTSGDRREPGYLHLALRGSDDRLVDLLVADTPGEWFKEWANDANAEGARGARQTMEHVDGVIFCIDPTELSGPDRLIKRATLKRLAGRLANAERIGPPAELVAVYTKNDATPAEEDSPLLKDVKTTIRARFPSHKSYTSVSSFENTKMAGTGILESVAALLEDICKASPTDGEHVVADREAQLAKFVKGTA